MKIPRIAIVARPGNLTRFLAPVIASLTTKAEVIVVTNGPGFDRWAALPGIQIETTRPSKSTLNRGPRALRSYLHWVRLGKHSWNYLEKYLSWLPEKRRPLMRKLHKTRLTKILALRPFAQRFEKLEKEEPPEAAIVEHLTQLAPDLILVIPVVFQNHPDVDYLKAGLHLGIPSGAVVPSWDNLTTKGIFHVTPDFVFVWNEIQRRECVDYHGLDAKTICMAGAPIFDAVFARRGLVSRKEFCQRAGLDSSEKFVLWAATSMGGGHDESAIVREVASQLPANVNILVRPHPKYSHAWKQSDFEGLNVVIWEGSRFAEDDTSVGEIISSVEHSCAVVGLSTSMFLEAAILDRPSALIQEPTRGTDLHSVYLHFKYLLDSKFIEICRDERAMAAWLTKVASNGDGKSDVRREFAASFLRPVDPERPAAEVMADQLLRLATKIS